MAAFPKGFPKGFPQLRISPKKQSGKGRQSLPKNAADWNSLLPKPTQQALQKYRLANQENLNQIPPFLAEQMFCPTKNSSYSQIVSNKKYIDDISNTPIPRLDCHVWYEIDGQIDDYTPIEIHMGFFSIICTEYEEYNTELQDKMRTYFEKLWKEKKDTLEKYQHEYMRQQDTCWMRCGVLHLLDPVKYNLDNLRIGSLGFKYKGRTYYHFG